MSTSAHLKDGAYVWHDFASFLECYDKLSRALQDRGRLCAADGNLSRRNLPPQARSTARSSFRPITASASASARTPISPASAKASEAPEKTGIEARMIVTGERHFGPEA
jgi:adenosine deaminase